MVKRVLDSPKLYIGKSLDNNCTLRLVKQAIMKETEHNAYFEAQEQAWNSLESIETDIWARLLRGALSSKDDYHQPVVATVSNGLSSLRTVVLRKVWTAEKALAFHTDMRSGKVSDLQNNPTISWLFYSPRHRVQIRVGGVARIETASDLVQAHWDKAAQRSVKCYLTTDPPGTTAPMATSGWPEIFEERDPSPEENAIGRTHFGIVVTDVQWIEWLWLNHKGHRRARFIYDDKKQFQASWLVP